MPETERHAEPADRNGIPPAMISAGDQEVHYGLRRFTDANANLLRMLSVLFAAAAFLRASPKGVATAILLFLVLAMILVVYRRLWQDLPLHFGVLPGIGWTAELLWFYYLFTITVVVSAYYAAAQYLERRHQYFWVVTGSVFALLVLAYVTRFSVGAERGLRWVAWVPGLDERRRAELSALLIGILVLLAVPAAYYVAYLLSTPVNHWLDHLLPGWGIAALVVA